MKVMIVVKKQEMKVKNLSKIALKLIKVKLNSLYYILLLDTSGMKKSFVRI